MDSPLTRDPDSFTVLSVDRYRGPRQHGFDAAHPYWEMVAVLGGSGELTGVDGCPLNRSDVVLIPPGVVHGEFAPAMLDTVWIGMSGRRLHRAGAVIMTVHDEGLCRLAEELWMQGAARADRSGGELDGQTLTLLGRFLRLAGGGSGGDLVDQAVRWLHQHVDRPVQVADLAKHLRISPAHLHRAFKARTRRSPKAFLNLLRVERAAHLLRHTALPAMRIATLTGFADPLYFSRAFTRATGLSPSRFRAQVPGDQGNDGQPA